MEHFLYTMECARLHTSLHSLSTAVLGGGNYYYLHFIDAETEAPRNLCFTVSEQTGSRYVTWAFQNSGASLTWPRALLPFVM